MTEFEQQLMTIPMLSQILPLMKMTILIKFINFEFKLLNYNCITFFKLWFQVIEVPSAPPISYDEVEKEQEQQEAFGKAVLQQIQVEKFSELRHL